MPKTKVTAPVYPDHDDLVCTKCGFVLEREAQPGQVLQPSPGYICDDCSDEANLPVYEAEIAEKPEGFTTAREAFLKNKIAAIKERVAEREEE